VCKVSSSHSVSGILSCLASDFVVLVLSEAVLSETVLVLDGCLKLRPCRSLIAAIRGTLWTNGPDSYVRSNRIEYEYEYEYRDAEYEYEKKHEQSTGPKCSIESF
jgi:hypothetical protein